MRKNTILLAVLLSLLLIVGACAKQGYPTGGPVDRTPPQVLQAQPPNGTTHFAAHEFTLRMDEYVTLKDADNNILVSPPLRQKPQYVLRGHNIVVRLADTLQDNTTYLFQFKGAIVDYNEGNALASYEYVFTTGDAIDSMTLRGRALDAFTLKPRKDAVSVLAYPAPMADSAVALGQPLYYTRCDTGGHFALNHLKPGRYHLIAIEDADRNLRLGAGEAVAFLDTALVAVPMPTPRDTAHADTAHADSTAHYGYLRPEPPVWQMFLSLETNEVQRIVKSALVTKGHLQLVAKQPLSGGCHLRHLMPDSALQLYTLRNSRGDTLDAWTSRGDIDSLVVVIADSATALCDTLTLQYRSQAIKGVTLKDAHEKLGVKSRVAAHHPYFDTLRVAFTNPVFRCHADLRATVTDLSDSTATSCPVRLEATAHCPALSAAIDFLGSPGGKYSIALPAGLFTDIYGNTSDSLTIATEYTLPENYGTLRLSLVAADSATASHTHATPAPSLTTLPLLVQLVNDKGDILRQHPCQGAQTLVFPHLKAGKYSFRIIVDRNGDGSWTPGNYWQHRQPEEVIYYHKTLDLRENWEIEEKWKI